MAKKKITGEWYDHGYWETGQRAGKGGYDSIKSLDFLSRQIAEQFARVFEWEGRKIVLLDAGCGPGFMVARWNELGILAHGVDFSRYALEKGAEIRPAVKKQCLIGNFIDLPHFKDELFDVIHCNQTLEHVYPEDVPQMVKEFARLTKPGGILICAMPIAAPWEDDPRKDEREPSHVNVRRIEYWHHWFGSAGFLIDQDAAVKFITEAQVWRHLKWQMIVYRKPESRWTGT